MSPLGKASKLLVLDEINKKTETNPKLDFNQIVFGTPIPNPKPLEYDRNTELRVTSITSAISGSTDVYYNRLDMQTLFTYSNIATVELDRPVPFTSLLQLLPELNTTYGLAIDSTDVMDGTPAAGNNQVLVAKADSYAWTGQLQIVLRGQPDPGLDLSDIITQNILDGLNYPDADITGIVRPNGFVGQLTGPLAVNNGFALGTQYDASQVWQYNNGEFQSAITVNSTQGGNPQATPQPDYKQFDITGDSVRVVGGMYIPMDSQDFHTLPEKYIIEFFIRSTEGAENLRRYTLVDANNNGTLSFVDTETRNPATGFTVQSYTQGTQFQFAIDMPTPVTGRYQTGIVAYRRNSIVARVANIIDFHVNQ